MEISSRRLVLGILHVHKQRISHHSKLRLFYSAKQQIKSFSYDGISSTQKVWATTNLGAKVS